MSRSKYDDTMPEKLIQHILHEDGDFETFGINLKDDAGNPAPVSRSTVYLWAEQHEDFAEAKELCKQHLRYKNLKEMHTFARGESDLLPEVQRIAIRARIFLCRVYGVRDDVPEETKQVEKSKIEINDLEKDL